MKIRFNSSHNFVVEGGNSGGSGVTVHGARAQAMIHGVTSLAGTKHGTAGNSPHN